ADRVGAGMTAAGALVPAIVLLGAAAFLVLETTGLASRRRRAAIDRVRAWVGTEAGPGAWRPRRTSAPGRAVARLAHRVTPAGSADRLAERISAAGLGGRLTVSDLL